MIDNEWHIRVSYRSGHEIIGPCQHSPGVAVLRLAACRSRLAIGFVRQIEWCASGKEHSLRPGKNGLS